ncbi:hypothetical protein [Bradyrhizobium sp. BWA-3-5]|uniref:hypothetical protein n=1 Tax=Bradyrhizobium sp. BWA-3-5 TaxID=3080013 RepID=UPI00293E273A|nr:hypothetical protein [Bradyrhizobium sp. BWA-3-5]WOH63421.1 hypothetical protein RX331_22085 [Bradyrhizobium sp. BWA-3-5]
MWLSKAARFNSEGGGSNPSQAVRLLWFLLFFLSPMASVAYVSQFELRHAGADALIHILWISAASLAVTLFCAVAQPIQIIDEATMTKLARANLCFALIDTLFFVILVRDFSAIDQACQPGAACRTYPVGWLALAGMHYCYAAWAYVTMLVNR